MQPPQNIGRSNSTFAFDLIRRKTLYLSYVVLFSVFSSRPSEPCKPSCGHSFAWWLVGLCLGWFWANIEICLKKSKFVPSQSHHSRNTTTHQHTLRTKPSQSQHNNTSTHTKNTPWNTQTQTQWRPTPPTTEPKQPISAPYTLSSIDKWFPELYLH
jgi:hypothetical protein